MILFQSDYQEGADAKVLAALQATNALQSPGYGDDALTAKVKDQIRALCRAPEAGVHFFVGGTQANLTVIAAALRPFEGVISSDLGHINTHETGAVEATGHKVLALRHTQGRISAEQIRTAYDAHTGDVNHEHSVRPAMVYLSHPTELGTLYTRHELDAIHAVAKACGLKLFLDGARLAYGLAAEEEVDLPYLAGICDAFTIGGTKCGALFGETAVLKNAADWPHFRYHIKQRGALLAKGRLLAVQFQTLLADGYYIELGREANRKAQRLKQAFLGKGYQLLADTKTNQIFPVLPNGALETLQKTFAFAFWEAVDSAHTAVRICVGVTTPEENVLALHSALEAL
ncbi:MAG: aminotransferase class I/II-fold pyridoxal phosphate-dependent enzyme [Clostridiales bacterium]|nr:aminotransferase class I/II-fold pyridoxal phosphate-dependent enzyme [Clostridiales bacterium]